MNSRYSSSFRLLPGAMVWLVLAVSSGTASFGIAAEAMVEEVRLSIPNALVGGKAAEYMREVFITVRIHEGRATAVWIGPKPGWNICGWIAQVERSDLTLTAETLRGTIVTQVHGSLISAGKYEFVIDARRADRGFTGTATVRFAAEKPTTHPVRGNLIPTPAAGPAMDGCFTLCLPAALPNEQPLTIYLALDHGKPTAAFAFATTYSRRPYEVDTSKLTVTAETLGGTVRVWRLGKSDPPDETTGTYQLDLRLAEERATGTFSGKTLKDEAVKGPVFGFWQARQTRPEKFRGWLKAEDGLVGGDFWQARVFFNFDLVAGRAVSGTAFNNKGVYEGRLDGIELSFERKDSRDRLMGELRCSVTESKVVRTGSYRMEFDGYTVGPVWMGRFTTHFPGSEPKSGYFVGGQK